MKNPKKSLLLAALYVLASMTVLRLFMRFMPDIPNAFVERIVITGFSTVLSIIGVVMFKRTAELKPKMKGLGKAFIAGFLLIALNGGYAIRYLIANSEPITAAPWEIVLFILHMLLIGISEETLYRAVLQNAALDVTGIDTPAAARKGILLGAVVFGLIHLGNIFSGVSLGSVVHQAVMAMPMGAILGAIYFRGNNLLAVVLIHAIVDGSSYIMSDVLSGASTGAAAEEIGGKGALGIVSFALFAGIALFLLRKKPMEKAIEARKAV